MRYPLDKLYDMYNSLSQDKLYPFRKIMQELLSAECIGIPISGYVYAIGSFDSQYPDYFAGMQYRSFSDSPRIINTLYDEKSPSIAPFYNFTSKWNNFKYGDLVVLVEGPKDVEGVKLFYEWALGILSSYPSFDQFTFLTLLTNKFLIIFDDDNSGRANARRLQRDFSYKNISAVSHTLTKADPGDALTKEEVKAQLSNILAFFI